MTWLDGVDNPEFLAAIYDGRAPSLDPVELFEVNFDRDGSTAMLRFNLPDFPTKLPRGWDKAGYNVAQVRLMLIGLLAARLDGWATSMTGPLRIERRSTFSVAFAAPKCALHIETEFLRVDSVSPYVLQR
jgi:hypothetical protein